MDYSDVCTFKAAFPDTMICPPFVEHQSILFHWVILVISCCQSVLSGITTNILQQTCSTGSAVILPIAFIQSPVTLWIEFNFALVFYT
jgi:hypothetical protein